MIVKKRIEGKVANEVESFQFQYITRMTIPFPSFLQPNPSGFITISHSNSHFLFPISFPSLLFPTNTPPLVVAIIIIRGHFLVFHLHLLHQSLQIRILLSLCNARLPLIPFPIAYRDLHDQVSFILLNDAIQLGDRFRQQFDSVLILHRRRRHHVQRRSD